MLCDLGPTPEVIGPRADPPAVPIAPPRWLSAAPPLRTAGEAVQLAPGVWIVRHRQWHPPGDLDTVADLPDPPDATPPPRGPDHYQPPGWHRRALCGRLSLDLSDPLFFGADDNLPPEELIVSVDAARRVCQRCPVARTCLAAALEGDLRYGVWGGTSGKQRQKMRVRIAGGASVAQLVEETLPHKAIS